MAEAPAQERTERPTRDRLRDARKDGKVPQSKELPSALMITILLVVLAMTAAGLYQFFVFQARQGLSLEMRGSLGLGGYTHLFKTKIAQSMETLAPFLLAGVGVSIFSSLIVSGWAFCPKSIGLKLGRISPLAGIKKLFSLAALFNLLVCVVKLAVLLAIVWDYLDGKLADCLALRWETPAAMLARIARLVFGMVVRIAIAILAIGVIDWLYQKWNYIRQLRMTKEEIKREAKEKEMSPTVKGRIRGVQIEMVRRRMLQEVPQADVVLANPTHVAVALRYDSGTMDAPTVVAKGAELLCEKIKEIARAHNVPVLQKPELARAIYNTVEVGQPIPETLFVAVAEILAMIYRAGRKRRSVSKKTT